MTRAYYNEFDPFAAAWLRELIKEKQIVEGDVDERSIKEVQSKDIKDYTQCHFFAGIGVWSYALKQAEWPNNRQVWTGSCPCQPFSNAGRKGGFDDERHLWPEFFRLIKECSPDTVFGEQVASKDGLTWLDLVSADLEEQNYAIGSIDTCAAGFGAPHIRQRLYWVADSQQRRGLNGGRLHGGRTQESEWGETAIGSESRKQIKGNSSINETIRMGQSNRTRPQPRNSTAKTTRQGHPAFTTGFWSECSWLPCIDGKTRPVESGTFPVAYGIKNRVGLLRGYGNALVGPQAQGFIEAYLEIEKL